jgi:ribosomal protein S24E
MKFREMYWYLKNLHNKTISRKKVQRNLAEFREIKITFVVISYFAK